MMITPTQTRVINDRRQDLLTAAAHARLITAATPTRVTDDRRQELLAATPPTVGRIRASLRQAVASLVGLASIG